MAGCGSAERLCSGLRAVIETLSEIAEQCDGVRCDMAMLVMNDVFATNLG